MYVITNVVAALDVGGGRVGVFLSLLIGGADVEIVEVTAIYKGLKLAVDRHLLFCSLC